jgi:short-subunit dehydrogenase
MGKAQDLKGRTALITGASSGLGVEFTRQLAARGTDVILAARRKGKLEEVATEIKTTCGVNVFVYTADLSQPDAPLALYNAIKKDGHNVDILINNAGFGTFGHFNDIPWERTAQMLDLDIRALTYLTKLFLEDMKQRNFGRILLIASIAAYQPSPTYAAYAGAKAYVLLFGEALRFELKKQKLNIHVSVLSPGVTDTEFFKVAGQKPTPYQRLFMMQPKKVVRIGINGMLSNKPSRIPGFMNWFLAFSTRFVPRRAVPPMGYSLMKEK